MKIYKRINFLNKKKLIWKGEKKDFSISIIKEKGKNPELHLEFFLKGIDEEHSNCLVYLADYQRTAQHINFRELGTVKYLQNSGSQSFNLDDISYEKFRFDIKIINEKNGRIVSQATRVKPDFIDEENDDYKLSDDKAKSSSLIRWRVKAMDAPWTVYIEEDSSPRWYLNKSISLKQNLGTSKIHKTLVHPAILREILLRYIASTDIPEDDKWKKRFFEFASKIYDSPIPSKINERQYTAEIDDWLEKVIELYSKDKKFVGMYNQEMDNK